MLETLPKSLHLLELIGNRVNMVQIFNLGGHSWDLSRELDQFTTQLNVAVQVLLDLLLELLGLRKNLLKLDTVLIADVGV